MRLRVEIRLSFLWAHGRCVVEQHHVMEGGPGMGSKKPCDRPVLWRQTNEHKNTDRSELTPGVLTLAHTLPAALLPGGQGHWLLASSKAGLSLCHHPPLHPPRLLSHPSTTASCSNTSSSCRGQALPGCPPLSFHSCHAPFSVTNETSLS